MSPLDLLAQVLTWSKRSVKYTDKPFFLKNHIYLCIYDILIKLQTNILFNILVGQCCKNV